MTVLDVLLFMPMIVGMFFKAIHNLKLNEEIDASEKSALPGLRRSSGLNAKNRDQFLIKCLTCFLIFLATTFFIIGIFNVFSGSSDYMMRLAFMFSGFLLTTSKKNNQNPGRPEKLHAKTKTEINNWYTEDYGLLINSFKTNVCLIATGGLLIIELALEGYLNEMMVIKIINIVMIGVFYYYCTRYLSNEDKTTYNKSYKNDIKQETYHVIFDNLKQKNGQSSQDDQNQPIVWKQEDDKPPFHKNLKQ